MNSKKKLLIALFMAIFLMPIGYASLAKLLNVNETASISAEWNVEITSIKVKKQIGSTDRKRPIITNRTATFDVNLQYPGASSTYLVTITNNGTINAKLSSITGVDTANLTVPTYIQYTVIKTDANNELNVNESKTFEVTVKWLSNDDKINIKPKNKTATINFNYIQNQ